MQNIQKQVIGLRLQIMQGYIIGIKVDTDVLFGGDKPKIDANGVTQNEPVVKPNVVNSKQDAQDARDNANAIKLRYTTNYDFFGANLELDAFKSGQMVYNLTVFGTIHTDYRTYKDYQMNGLNSDGGIILMHEYGHYLDAQYSTLNFYTYGLGSSLITSSFSWSDSNWTEIKANTMSYYYFHYPSIFNNNNQYPINANYISDELKYKLYYHLKP